MGSQPGHACRGWPRLEAALSLVAPPPPPPPPPPPRPAPPPPPPPLPLPLPLSLAPLLPLSLAWRGWGVLAASVR